MVKIVKSASLLVSTTAVLVEIPPGRLAIVFHTGLAADESTASTGRLHINCAGGTAVTGATVGEGIHSIPSGASWPVPDGIGRFSIIAPSETLVDVICSEP